MDDVAHQVDKVVWYLVHEDHLLVFTHDTVPMTITGVQVPAGTVEAGETPAQAAVRELHEESGLQGRVVRVLGTGSYDMRPARQEVAVRHFVLMAVDRADVHERWGAGEATPSGGSAAVAWTCWWLPLADGHVLAAGLGAMLARV